MGKSDGRPRHLQFAVRAAARYGLDGVPVAVARGEILRRVDSGRIEAQQMLDQTEFLDELTPVHCRYEA